MLLVVSHLTLSDILMLSRNWCCVFVTCVFFFVMLSVTLVSCLLLTADCCLPIFICCSFYLCLLSLNFFLPSLFLCLECVQEPYGVMHALSFYLPMCLFVSCAFLPVHLSWFIDISVAAAFLSQ